VKDWPKYTALKYYYSDKKTSDKFLFDQEKVKNGISGYLIARLILTEDGCIYLNLLEGNIIIPDELRDDRIIPLEWIPQKGIHFAIDYQPYDFNECWCRGHGLFSKEFWRLAFTDIRDFKIKISLGEFEPTGEWWG